MNRFSRLKQSCVLGDIVKTFLLSLDTTSDPAYQKPEGDLDKITNYEKTLNFSDNETPDRLSSNDLFPGFSYPMEFDYSSGDHGVISPSTTYPGLL